MTLYICLIGITILLNFCIGTLKLDYDNKRKLFLWSTFLILIFIGGFRSDTVGGDLANYIQWYNDTKGLSLSEYLIKMERVGGKGYFIITYFISQINDSPSFLKFSCSLFTLSSVAIFIQRFSKDCLLSIVIFICMGYYINTFNNVRSSIAYAILLYSYPYIISRKYIKFIIIYGLALCVHSSIFPFVVVYFIIKPKFNIYITLSLGLLSYLVYSILEPYIMLLMSMYSERYVFAQELYSNSKGTSLFLLLCCYLIFANIYLKSDKKSIIFYNAFSIAVLLQPLASIAGNLNRLTQIFAWSLMILIPNVIANIKNSRISLLSKTTLLVLLTIYFMFFICKINPATGTNSSATIPYSFSLNNS